MDNVGKPVNIYAAGSLRTVLPALTSAFTTTAINVPFQVRYGPAGLLRECIEAGDRPDLFLSANLAHPSRLAESGHARPPVVFARNTLAAIVRKDAGITTENFVDRLLSPEVAIATSTPLKDPSGDYAWDVFRRIDRIRPGAFGVLDTKAQILVGAAEPTQPPGNYDAVAAALKAGTASVFLGYRTGLSGLAANVDGTEIVTIPPEVNAEPLYGMAALSDCSPAGLAFALFVLSVPGQKLLADSGFHSVTPLVVA